MTLKDKILITGGSGFIGANLARKLVDAGFKVNILSRGRSYEWRLKGILEKVNIYNIDLIDKHRLEEAVKKIKPNYIFHTAAHSIFRGEDYTSRSQDIINANLIGTINLLEACECVNYEAFINTGSSSEYGAKKVPMKEEDLCEPENIYSISKLAATNFACCYAKINKRPIITFRIFSPYGSFDDKRRLIPEIIISCLKNKNVKISNPKAPRDFIYIDDICDIYLKAMHKAKDFSGEIFNLGSGRQYQVFDVVSRIARLTGFKGNIDIKERVKEMVEPDIWQANITKISKLLGFEPKHEIDKGLEKTINWFRNNLNLYG